MNAAHYLIQAAVKEASLFAVPRIGPAIGEVMSHAPRGQLINHAVPLNDRGVGQKLRELQMKRMSDVSKVRSQAVRSGGLNPQGLEGLMPGARPAKELELASRGFNMMHGE